MDIIHLLQKVKNIDDYINVTHIICDPSKEFALYLNQKTVHTIKQVKAFEIEHLHKSYGNGAASILIKRLLKIPPGRAWVVAGRELVTVLRYWLDAIRKHLINHSTNWWSFLQLILMFINCILNKDEIKDTRGIPRIGTRIGDMLAELTAECLFDLATNDKTDVHQKYEILHCLNRFCAVCSREIRHAKQEDLDRQYFVSVGKLVWDSGYAPLQQGALESLVRWLVRRTCATTRSEAAARWFPSPCPQQARDVFTNNTWSRNFFEDSRQFLNTLNEFNGQVTSVICKKLFFGETMFITGTERYRMWVDMNPAHKSVTVQLPSRVLAADANEALLVRADNAAQAHLTGTSEEIKLVIQTHEPCPLIPSNTILKNDRLITFVVGSTNLVKFNQALRSIFEDKYQVYMDLMTKTLPLTPPMPKEIRMSSDEDSRFSILAENIRHTFGPAVPKRSGLATPSSVSSSSLAQLHEKLEALPNTNPFAKETPVVSLRPQLSSVTENSEFDDKSFHSMSTLKLGHPSVYKNLCLNKKATEAKKLPKSPVNKGYPITQSTPSNDSVINDTIQSPNDEIQNSSEPLDPKMVDQLVKEALNLGDSEAEFIDNTPATKVKTTPIKTPPVKYVPKKVCTVLSATDEESNTTVFNDNPMFSNARKGKFGKLLRKQYASKDTKIEKPDTTEINTKTPVVLVQKLEAKTGADVNIQKDIKNPLLFEHDENDVLECLNSLVTKVCDDMNKCIMFLHSDQVETDDTNKSKVKSKKQKEKKTIKLKFNPPKSKKGKENVNKDSSNEIFQQQIVTRGRKKYAKVKPVQNEMNVIIEEDISVSSISKPTPVCVNTTDGTLIKRRRKLYSPERNDLEERSPISNPKEPVISSDNSDTPLIKRKKRLYSSNGHDVETNINQEEKDAPLSSYKAKKTKTTASIYSDLEKERKNRPRRSLTKKRVKTEEPPSPRTLKLNAAFENAKSLESNEKIVLAETNKASVYNFSSDSDSNDDFKIKLRRFGSPTGKRRAKTYQNALTDKNGKSQRKRKTPMKTRSKTNLKIEPSRDLIDERMREAIPVANETVVDTVDKPKKAKLNLEPKLKDPPQMEFIDEVHTKDRKKKKNKLDTPALVEDNIQDFEDKDTNRTLSPLPTLVIESVSKKIQDDDALNLTNMSNLKQLLKNVDNPNADVSNVTQNTLLDIDKYIDIDEGVISDQNNETIPKNVKTQMKRRAKNMSNIEKEDVYAHLDTENFKVDEDVISEQNNDKMTKKDSSEIKICSKKIKNRNAKNNEVSLINNSGNTITDGITAHGAMDEEPPNTEILERSHQPRELEDLDDSSIKDYYTKINKEINKDLGERRSKSKETTSPEAVVHLQRLSMEDIAIYLPSQKSSETDSSLRYSPSIRSEIESRHSFKNLRLIIPSSSKAKSNRNVNNESSQKSKENSKHLYNTRIKTKIIKEKKMPKRKQIRASIESVRQSVKNTTKYKGNENNDLDKSIKTKDRSNSSKIQASSINEKSDNSVKSGAKTNMETCMCPSAFRRISKESQHSIKGTFNAVPTGTKKGEDAEKALEGTFNATIVFQTEKNIQDSWSNTGSNKFSPVMAKKGLAAQSGSSTSVTEWLRRINEPSSSKENDSRFIMKDALQGVMEKLDTTLPEINRNTSKKLGNSFVEIQRQLKAMEEEETQRSNEFIAKLDKFKLDFIQEFKTKLEDLKSEFIDATNVSRGKTSEFLNNLKKQGFGVLREDCKQKRALVAILKEDVEAVIEHLNKGGH